MDTVRAFDSDGNEVFPTFISSICPIEFVDLARHISMEFFRDTYKIVEPESTFLPVRLKKPSEDFPSYVACFRSGYTHERDAQIEKMASVGEAWCGDRLYSVEEDPAEIRTKFVCLADDRTAVLESLGLEVVE